MTLEDLHTHTRYCDGKNTPEEMVKAAIEKGLTRIGFSGHSYTFFDERYCMSIPNVIRYIAEINGLKESYRGKIEILCGVEQDGSRMDRRKRHRCLHRNRNVLERISQHSYCNA